MKATTNHCEPVRATRYICAGCALHKCPAEGLESRQCSTCQALSWQCPEKAVLPGFTEALELPPSVVMGDSLTHSYSATLFSHPWDAQPSSLYSCHSITVFLISRYCPKISQFPKVERFFIDYIVF